MLRSNSAVHGRDVKRCGFGEPQAYARLCGARTRSICRRSLGINRAPNSKINTTRTCEQALRRLPDGSAPGQKVGCAIVKCRTAVGKTLSWKPVLFVRRDGECFSTCRVASGGESDDAKKLAGN